MKAKFKEGSNSRFFILAKSGIILETETDVPVSDLPQIVQSYENDHSKGTRIKEASKIIESNSKVHYEAEVNCKDVLLNTIGMFSK
jgi:hypothetical protein